MHEDTQCPGHPSGPNDPLGEAVYCDGTCQVGPRSAGKITMDPAQYQALAEFLSEDGTIGELRLEQQGTSGIIKVTPSTGGHDDRIVLLFEETY